MKIRFMTRIALILLCLGVGFGSFVPASLAEDTDASTLRFHQDGTFTVMLLSDLQDTQLPSPLLLDAMKNVLSDFSADLIVLLGDQLEGLRPLMRLGRGTDNVATAIDRLLQPIVESGIPFAVVFGNHDYDAPLSIVRQVALYERYETCVGVCYGDGLSETGAFSLPVRTYNDDVEALRLYFFDSGEYLANGDYGAVSAEQVAWYVEQSALVREQNGGSPVPSVAFTHVPPAEVYELFTETDATTKDAYAGVGVGAGKRYLPDESRIFLGEAREAPCPSSVNNGLFDAFVGCDNVFLTVSGHDHVNSFIGSLRGVDIASAPASSYTSYGSDEARGVRLFRFTEHNVKDYETIHVRYAEYNTAASFGPVRYYLMTTTRLPNALKLLLAAVLLLAAAGVLVSLILHRKKHPRPVQASGPSEFDDDAPEIDDRKP